jgi:NAD+ kinase
MRRVALVVHEGRPAAVEAARGIEAILRAADAEPFRTGEHDAPPERTDLVISVGGDGTFLRAAHVAALAGAPVLGVKVGRMGFLTEVGPDGAEPLVRSFLSGAATVDERLAVTAEPDGEGSFDAQWALNEIMVEKRARHRLIRLAVWVDGDYVTTFSADGVIVATPTGSTAYSFSARGPIVAPDVECLVLTPIAAHMVFDRSFVLDAAQQVTLEVRGDEPGLLSADGRESIELPVGSRIRIRASARPARLVRRDGAPGFLTLVREKFGLPGESDVGGPR